MALGSHNHWNSRDAIILWIVVIVAGT